MRRIFTLQFLVNIIHAGKKEARIISGIDEELYEAPDHCVETILNFARAYRVAECETTGKVEMILN